MGDEVVGVEVVVGEGAVNEVSAEVVGRVVQLSFVFTSHFLQRSTPSIDALLAFLHVPIAEPKSELQSNKSSFYL